MATVYPSQIDTAITLATVVDNSSSVDAVVVNRLRDAIIAIEAQLGIDPAVMYGTVRMRLDVIEAAINSEQGEVISLAGDLGGTLANPLVIGLQGRPISPLIPGIGEVLTWNGFFWTPEFPAASEEYTISLSGPPAFLEIGQILFNPIFNATYLSDQILVAPTTASIQDNVGNPSQNIITENPPFTPNNFVYDQQYQYSSFPSTPFSVVFTLTSSDGSANATANTTTTWGQKIYYGVADPGGDTSAFIQSLSSTVSATLNTQFTVNATDGYAIYFAYRSAFGTATFWVDGWEGGFTLISDTISLTNAYGFTEDYTLYQSDQVGLGLTTVNVL